ncbi:MAG TPA: hypothetical protein VJW73_02810 [Gemmatimonadaceae bacterium]|nr:hypothetical protein [Gemmatimonadaceae bacterium]
MHRRFLLGALALCLLACDSPTRPNTNVQSLSFQSSISGSVARGDTVAYRLNVKAGQLFVVFVDALDSAIVIQVVDSHGVLLGSGNSTGPRATGASFEWTPITASSDGTDTVRVTTSRASGGGRYVLRPTLIVTTPEHVPAAYVPNDTIANEALDNPADVDDFTFTGAAGQVVNLFLQNRGTPQSAVAAELYDDDQPVTPPGSSPLPVARVAFASPGSDLEAGASGRYTLRSSGHYRIRIHSAITVRLDSSAVPYRFQLYVIDTLPEHASPQLMPGDTITESIDHVGDIDSYIINAPPGTLLNLFVAPALPGPNTIFATVRNASSSAYLANFFVNPGAPLLDSPSGRFLVPASGTVSVHIEEGSTGALYRGSYRLFVYPVDLAPETGSSMLELGAAPVTGAIDQYGDVDEYSFTVDHQAVVALRTNKALSYPGELRYRVISDATGYDVMNTLDYDRAELSAGSYRLRIDPGTAQSSYRGPYQFVLASLDTLPENAPATIGANQTISVESSAWPDDIDRFVFTATAADTILFTFTRSPNEPTWDQSFWVTELATGQRTTANVAGDVAQVARIDMTPGAQYQLHVEGANTTWQPGTSAAYTLSAQRVTAAPEHRPATIAVGDTIRDLLDYYGDIDDYVLTGTPGQEINLSGAFDVSLPYGGPLLRMTVSDPATNAALAFIDAQPNAVWSSTVRIPAGGSVKVRVCVGTNCATPSCGFTCGAVPPAVLPGYWLVVNRIDRAPEVLPATFTLGDTIRGEAIDQPGDIDEFTFTGLANQNVQIGFQYYTDGWPATPALGLQLEVVDLTTSSSLATITAPSTVLDGPGLPTITLPRDGSYLVRIQAQTQLAYDNRNWGPYHFRLAAIP